MARSMKSVKFYCAEQQIFLRQCWAVPQEWHEDLIHTKNGKLFYKNKEVNYDPLCKFDDAIDSLIEYCYKNTTMRVFECANKFDLEINGIYLKSLDKVEEWTPQQTLDWVSENLAQILID